MYALSKVTRTVVTWTACTALVMDTLERECCIRGYHIYAHIAAVGEVLDCCREPDNNDRYAMTVVKSDTIEKWRSSAMRRSYSTKKFT